MSSLAVGSAVTSVLVAYATKYGATREVAEAVAAALRGHGADVKVRAAGEAIDVDRYSAVVLGGALFYFRWHRDAKRFLTHHRAALVRLPVAVFALGPLGDSAEEMKDAREQLDGILAKSPWLSPASVAVFGGRLDPARLRFPDANPAMKKLPACDLRDWDAIQDWANSLPTTLGLDA